MNREGNRGVKNALRSQKHTRGHQQGTILKKDKETTSKDDRSSSHTIEKVHCDSGEEVKTSGVQAKRPGKVTRSAIAECRRSPGAQRKLSDSSNASEDLSKDSGCLSGKLSSSDSSSEISDCPSDGNKLDSPSSDNELIWLEARAYESPDSEGKDDGKQRVKAARETCALLPDAPGGSLTLFNSSGAFIDLMMGETTEDLVREVDDLRSENEYLKVSQI